ncbi:MAG TPA: GFA family protein [Gaiellales bacterium]|nr:GFA family protein [Gaiellales bacterium]
MAYACHRSNCRATTGSAFLPWGEIERETFEITKGTTSLTRVGDAGADHGMRGGACWSLVAWTRTALEGVYVRVPYGTLIDEPALKPTAHMFVGSKAPWYEILDDLPQHDGGRRLIAGRAVRPLRGSGFDVLAVTDHWHVTVPERDDLVIVPASELSCRAPTPSGEAEALALGVAVLPEPREPFPDLESMAAWIAGRGGAAYLCHPYWSGLTAADVMSAPSLAGIEVWNGSSELLQGNGLSSVHWDGALQHDRMLFGLATDDCHSPGQDSGLGWTWVFANERSPAAVVEALRTGSAYGRPGRGCSRWRSARRASTCAAHRRARCDSGRAPGTAVR